ncbi:MAG: peptidase U34 [Firmicutes bacterium]|nr:C69 family dipeptidase [Bacillota bacterium]NLL87786.1 peptidase U34 [Bacillota bacterium]
MCDTIVALGNSTENSTVIFAKNSDRQPNEPHIMIRVPRRTYPKGAKVKCTYIEVDQVPETCAVLLLKPSWIWGAEMGCNEWGLNIGNEAVFTREKQGPPSLLGMDLLRLALERCKTSGEALHLIVELLQRYGQGGNCGYERSFVYHNSFLIADPNTAWVLETAGKFWAAQKVKDVRCISNRLSIGQDFDLAHPQLVENAVKKGWCRSEADFDFARCYTEPVFTRFSGSKQRYEFCRNKLEASKGTINTATMIEILSGHDPKLANPFTCHSLTSVCMHAGFLFGDHTTGSYIAEIGARQATYWLTGSSTPCIGVFKPYWLIDHELPMVFSEADTDKALAFWHLRETLHRMVLQHQVDLESYREKRGRLQQELLAMVDGLDFDAADPKRLAEVMDYGLAAETKLVTETINAGKNIPGRIKGSPYFRYYWKKHNRGLNPEKEVVLQ